MTGETRTSSEDILTYDKSDNNNMELQTDDQKVSATSTTAKDLLTATTFNHHHQPPGEGDFKLDSLTTTSPRMCTMLDHHQGDDAPPPALVRVGDVKEVAELTMNEVRSRREVVTTSGSQLDTTAVDQSVSLLFQLSRGLDFSEDFPMIDDDDVEEVDGDVGRPRTGHPDSTEEAGSDVGPQSDPSTKGSLEVRDEPSSAGVNLTSDGHKEDRDSRAEGSNSSSSGEPSHSGPAPLKSALKKSRSRSNKGLRVSFHDTRVFYIDTEAEATAEPQLLTVRSLDLPLASTDYRIVFPTYDYVPRASRDGMSDGEVVSLQCYNGAADENADDQSEECTVEQKTQVGGHHLTATANVNSEDEGTTSGSNDEVADQACKRTEAGPETVGASALPQAEELVEALVSVERIESAVETPNVAIFEPIPSLTEANLRQHEILMERDVTVTTDGDHAADSDSVPVAKPEVLETDLDAFVDVPAPQLPPSHAAAATTAAAQTSATSVPVPCKPDSAGGKTLSPPLKELTVDVHTISNGSATGSEWQVELSPLNSIPDSETDSSHSSQDTIIMMTSEESRRNDEHIRLSMLAAHQRLGAPYKNGLDTASVGGSSQDSDETLKYEEHQGGDHAEGRPTWTKAVDWENSSLVDRAGGGQRSTSEGGVPNQRTNSAIRQLMERNAAKRNVLRYSGTKKKIMSEAVEGAVEKQRQWRSHESLLDTINKLAVEDTGVQVDTQEPPVTEWPVVHRMDASRAPGDSRTNSLSSTTSKYWDANGYYIPQSSVDGKHVQNGGGTLHHQHSPNGGVYGVKESNNLSLQDLRGATLVSMRDVDDISHARRTQSVANVNVPGDVRQWKIHSQAWNEFRGNHIPNGGGTAPQYSSLPHALNGGSSSHLPPETSPLIGRGIPPQMRSSDSNIYQGSGQQQQQPFLVVDPGDDDDVSTDELAQFVQQDQARIERIRKRYSYSDGSDYEQVNAFARRPSVRGIKPRFGSTTEILKQMQGQLQPSPLANPPNGRNIMSWPYPVEMTNGATPAGSHPPMLVNPVQRSVVPSNSTSAPYSSEDIYGTGPSKRSSYSSSGDSKPPYVRVRRGREGTYVQVHSAAPGQPPPYQPPPPPPGHLQGPIYQQLPPPSPVPLQGPAYQQQLPPSPVQLQGPIYQQQHRLKQHVPPQHLQGPPGGHHHNNNKAYNQYPVGQQHLTSPPQASPLRIHAKDERGAPEGASSSPQVAFDSMYQHHPHQAVRHPASSMSNGNARALTATDSSGVVYYVMQV